MFCDKLVFYTLHTLSKLRIPNHTFEKSITCSHFPLASIVCETMPKLKPLQSINSYCFGENRCIGFDCTRTRNENHTNIRICHNTAHCCYLCNFVSLIIFFILFVITFNERPSNKYNQSQQSNNNNNNDTNHSNQFNQCPLLYTMSNHNSYNYSTQNKNLSIYYNNDYKWKWRYDIIKIKQQSQNNINPIIQHQCPTHNDVGLFYNNNKTTHTKLKEIHTQLFW